MKPTEFQKGFYHETYRRFDFDRRSLLWRTDRLLCRQGYHAVRTALENAE
ncbi:hypothetical protein [uncultured Gemmiger sp.]|nr:hypothetical protein [uncultured Gemmiger sp.]